MKKQKKNDLKIKGWFKELPARAVCFVYNTGLALLTGILSAATFAVMLYLSVITTSLFTGLFGFDLNQVNIIVVMGILVISMFTVLSMTALFKQAVRFYVQNIFKKRRMHYGDGKEDVSV